MEIWTAASQVKGLLPEGATPPAGSDSGSRSRAAMRDSPRDAATARGGAAEARWIDGPPADDATPATVSRVPTASPASSAAQKSPAAAVARRPAGGLLAELPKYLRLFGIGLIAVGLLLVLAAKGCDTLADRYTARVLALARVEQERFQQQWNRERQAMEAAIEGLEAKSNPTATEQNQLVSRRMELQKLNQERMPRKKSRSRKAAGPSCKTAAATAADDNRAWGFWRGILFVFGTLVLVPGLLVVGFTGQNAEALDRAGDCSAW